MVELPDGMPIPISKLPVNKVGYPIPWFVYIDPRTGEEDFRVIRDSGIALAYNNRLCWICGEPRTGMESFVIGPMCSVNHVSAEPPSHPTCARWAAIACPFLARPDMIRRERGLDHHIEAAGNMIKRNPGVALVWHVRSKDWEPFSDGSGRPDGVLFDIGEPRSVEWYCRGRAATREEVMAAIDSGLPILMESAVEQGDEAVAMLNSEYERALELVPA